MKYRHPDGSYSAFGPGGEDGSIWLTAFVVKCFAQASPFIYVDPELQHESMDFFMDNQDDDGCFPQVCKYINVIFPRYMVLSLLSYVMNFLYFIMSYNLHVPINFISTCTYNASQKTTHTMIILYFAYFYLFCLFIVYFYLFYLHTFICIYTHVNIMMVYGGVTDIVVTYL